MWIVYNHEDSWTQGYSVQNEAEAREICKGNEDMTYSYIDMELLTA